MVRLSGPAGLRRGHFADKPGFGGGGGNCTVGPFRPLTRDIPPDQAVEHYRAALDLVTGRPFSYPNAARASYGWVDFEHHATTWELRVEGVAQACAAMYLDAGEPDKAITMLRRVIQAIPLNSAVVEALMRAHIADEDRAGAENVYGEHVAALEQAKLGDPEDSIEQLLLELHTR